LIAQVPEIAFAHRSIGSEIGRPINQPQIVDVRIDAAPDRALSGLRPVVQTVVRPELEARATSPTSCSMAPLRLTAGLLRVADPRFGSQR
jgi:S-adenosylmethionine synthetase